MAATDADLVKRLDLLGDEDRSVVFDFLLAKTFDFNEIGGHSQADSASSAIDGEGDSTVD